jgi:hypothetical protein
MEKLFAMSILEMSFVPVSREPSSADSVLVDPTTGIAAVAFKEGFSYLYKNVDTKEIKNLQKALTKIITWLTCIGEMGILKRLKNDSFKSRHQKPLSKQGHQSSGG